MSHGGASFIGGFQFQIAALRGCFFKSVMISSTCGVWLQSALQALPVQSAFAISATPRPRLFS